MTREFTELWISSLIALFVSDFHSWNLRVGAVSPSKLDFWGVGNHVTFSGTDEAIVRGSVTILRPTVNFFIIYPEAKTLVGSLSKRVFLYPTRNFEQKIHQLIEMVSVKTIKFYSQFPIFWSFFWNFNLDWVWISLLSSFRIDYRWRRIS